jgi:hypothetical protein
MTRNRPWLEQDYPTRQSLIKYVPMASTAFFRVHTADFCTVGLPEDFPVVVEIWPLKR